MNRIRFFAPVLLTLLLLTACSQESPESSAPDVTAETPAISAPQIDYEAPDIDAQIEISETAASNAPQSAPANGMYCFTQTLNDPTSGVPVISALVPSGWNGSLECDWGFLSTASPGAATARFDSGDGTANLYILTRRDYGYMHDNSGFMPDTEGADYKAYVIHRNYTTAPDMAEAILDEMFTLPRRLLSEETEPPELEKDMEAQLARVADEMKQASDAAMYGSGSNTTLEGYELTTSVKRHEFTGENGETYITETTCVVCGVRLLFETPSLGMSYTTIPWFYPCAMIYTAAGQEAFDAHYNEYKLIKDSTEIRSEFLQLNHLYGSKIRDAVNKGQTEALKAINESSANELLQSGESGETYSSVDRMSDTILDLNDFTLSDGSHVKVPTSYDVVAQNSSGGLFVGGRGDIPFGYDVIVPN